MSPSLHFHPKVFRRRMTFRNFCFICPGLRDGIAICPILLVKSSEVLGDYESRVGKKLFIYSTFKGFFPSKKKEKSGQMTGKSG